MTVAVDTKLNSQKYGELLRKVQPRRIRTESEYDRVAEIVSRLAVKGEHNLAPEEDALLELLTVLIEHYDEEHYQIPDAPPHAVIRMLMQDRGLRHKDLMPVLGSRGTTSDVINGKRNPSKSQIKALAAFFKVPPEVFVSLEQ
ncbi:MAG: helix-turn-helix domain-containing protein [Blastocatellia bacterium]|nr:helix-turn-helix domain-containing protein [Blastocatellia bacterium]